MTRLIDADALIKELEKVYEYHMAEVKNANKHPEKYTSKFIPATAGRIDGIVDAEIVINDAPTIEPDGDLISRQDAIAEFKDGRDVFDIMESIEELPSAEAEQVTGKLNKRDDSLLKSDSDECKEQKSKLDLISRQDAVKEIDSFCGEVWTESEADFARGLGTALSIVESLPSAPDSRQRGVWVTTAEDRHLFTDKFQEDIRENIFGGADMRKGGDDE